MLGFYTRFFKVLVLVAGIFSSANCSTKTYGQRDLFGYGITRHTAAAAAVAPLHHAAPAVAPHRVTVAVAPLSTYDWFTNDKGNVLVRHITGALAATIYRKNGAIAAIFNHLNGAVASDDFFPTDEEAKRWVVAAAGRAGENLAPKRR